MAYISQEQKKVIAAKLKIALKDSGIKYSLGITHYSTLYMTITESPINFLEECKEQWDCFTNTVAPTPKYLQLMSQYRYEDFEGKSKDTIKAILEILFSAGWYGRSDAQTDYFDTAYYVILNIGKWDKPYKLSVN